MRENFNSLVIFEVRRTLCDGRRFHPDVPGCYSGNHKHYFYLKVHIFSFDIMQHLCSISDTSIWKDSISFQRQCNISFPAVKVRATAARPPLCFMLSGAYLHS